MFLLISGAHIGAPKWYTNNIDMASRYKALHVLAKNSETVGHEDLICCVTVKMIYKLSSCEIESNVSSLN